MAGAGGVDTSLYGQIQPIKIPNLLGMAQEFAQTQHTLQENTMQQQTLQARKVFGQIMQQAVGPDGQPDYEKAAVMMYMNPATAWAAPDFAKSMAVNKGLNLDNVKRGLDNAYAQQKAVAEALAPLTMYGNNVTQGQMVGVIQSLQKQGVITPEMAFQVSGQMPNGGQAGAQFINDYYRRAQTTVETIEQTQGKGMAVGIGGGTVLGAYSPQTGFRPQENFGNVQSPEALNALTDYISQPGDVDPVTGQQIPAGTKFTGSKALLFRQAQGTIPPGASPVGTGGQAAGGGNAPNPAATGAPPVGTGVGGGPPPSPSQGPQNAPSGGGGPSAITGPIVNPDQLGPKSVPPPPGSVPAGPPATRVTGVSDYVAAQRKAYGDNRAQVANSVADSVTQLMQAKAFLGHMGPGGATPSALGPIRAKMGAFIKATGFFAQRDPVTGEVTDPVADAIGNGSVSGSQIIAKLGGTNVFQTLHQLLGGQNRVTNLFISQLTDLLPTMATDPKAAVKIFQLFAQMYDVQRAELSMYDYFEGKRPGQNGKLIAKPLDPADIPAAWAQWLGYPAGIKTIDRIMKSKPAILEPEASNVVGQ